MKRTLFIFARRLSFVPRGLVVLALILSGAAIAPAWAQQHIEGRVVGVSDGDTITILDAGNRQHRIRLKGIDAPERGQAFGTASRRALAVPVSGRLVRVRIDSTDRFGRLLGVVFLGGRDVNLEMVRSGMAWHDKRFQRDQSLQERRTYAAAEDEARASRRGLWRDAQPVPPWEFRRQVSNGLILDNPKVHYAKAKLVSACLA